MSFKNQEDNNKRRILFTSTNNLEVVVNLDYSSTDKSLVLKNQIYRNSIRGNNYGKFN